MEFAYRISSSSSDAKFEMRTKFTVRRMLDEEGDDDAYDCEMLERECLPLSLSPDSSSDLGLLLQQFQRLKGRLSEYSMPDDQIQGLLRESLLRIASAAGDVIVDVSVCTVQKDGETMDEVMARSVRPESLTPLDPPRLLKGEPKGAVDDEEEEEGFKGLLVDACPICMGAPTSGPPMLRLPCCRQAVHAHCVVLWLLLVPSCPLCRFNSTNWAPIQFESPTLLGPEDVPAQRKRKRPSEDMPAHPPAKRNRQPSSWLKDYFVI